MRSILIHLWQTDESAVAKALGEAISYQQEQNQWTVFKEGDACLCIWIYRDGAMEVEDWERRFDTVGGLPSVSVMVDISGRHEGWPETQRLAAWLLRRFEGVAEDDGLERFWRLDEIEEDRVIDGQRFGLWRNGK
jgi:hypothetical protein